MPSSVARAMCADVVPRVSPRIAPRARGSQYGAPRPASAGTKYTPSLAVTRAARAAESRASAMIPRPSRSHWMAAPPMNTLPSSAYVRRPPRCRATVLSKPLCDSTGSSPVFISRKQPVP